MVARWIKGLLMVLLLLSGTQLLAAEVEVTIDRNPVQVNESFQLVFSLDQSPDREPDFSMLQQHFMVLGNNRSNSISIINGEYKRSVKWTLQLMAKQVGEFMVPAIHFGQDRSKPFQVTVQPSSLASVPHDQLLLELLVDQQEAYVQSQVLVTLRLLSATSLSGYSFGEIKPQGVDAVIEPLGDERQYQTRIADRSYLVLEKQFALFPQQSGQLTLAPVMAEVRLRSGSSFDPFRTGGEMKRLRSQSAGLEIKPLPSEFSGSYWLPAQKVELREDWQGDLAQLKAGEPITRNLTIIADGLTAAQLPALELAQIGGIKQYPDQPVLADSRGSSGIVGRREQKIALIPGSGGRFRIPELRLPWWNLQTGKMEVATIPARDLTVASVAAPAQVIPLQSAAPDSPSVVTGGAPVQAVPTSRFWLWLSLLLAVGWGLTLAYWWWSKRQPGKPAAQSEPPGLRQASRQLKKCCAENDASGARQALLEWGRAFFAPRPVPDLQRLEQMLGESLAEELSQSLSAAIAGLNQSLYAPQPVAWQGQQLDELVRQILAQQRRGPVDDGVLQPLNPSG